MDNYRGFKQTYIPITDVNFLVGEGMAEKTLQHQLACLLVVTESLFANGIKDPERIVDGKGNLHPSLKMQNYLAYQSATRMTIQALKRLTGKKVDPKDAKSAAALILQLSNEK